MKGIKFTKMHGIGNDYVYINCVAGPAEARTEACPADPATLAREVSDRHTGIGGDGLILILPSEKADFRMRMFNADGSEGRMCGNGTRCIGKYVYDHGLTDREKITLETLSGVKYLTLHKGADGKVAAVTVDMGAPAFAPADIPVNAPATDDIEVETATAGLVRLTAVSMGNPHAVAFVDEITDALVFETGKELERHAIFPERANIEFAHVISPDEIEMRVWERGSGETMACGTGACATAVAAVLTGRAGREVTVHLRGGDLHIKWDTETGHVMMTGPATEVFTGEWAA